MRRILITGGTVFVSRCVAEHFARLGDDVYVLNRNTRPQPEGTTLIEADRHCPGDALRGRSFDAVLDITAYTGEDVTTLLDALGEVGEYVLLSSSAVYPETLPQPYREDQPVGDNKVWGAYARGKNEAERCLTARVPSARILRPAYIYGPWNNLYREAFVFDCAMSGRSFYVPGEGAMKLQFYHVADLCAFVETLLALQPDERVFNLANDEVISVSDWVRLCYRIVGREPEIIGVNEPIGPREYFCFHNYEYRLDVSRQNRLAPHQKPLADGLREAFEWYTAHPDAVVRRPYQQYIDGHFAR